MEDRPRRVIRRSNRARGGTPQHADPLTLDAPPPLQTATTTADTTTTTSVDPAAAASARLRAHTNAVISQRAQRTSRARRRVVALHDPNEEGDGEGEGEAEATPSTAPNEDQTNPIGVATSRTRRPPSSRRDAPTTVVVSSSTPSTPPLKPITEILAPVDLKLDPAVFTRIAFSAPTFVNNIPLRIVNPLIQQRREAMKEGGENSRQSDRSRLRGNDGSTLFSNLSYDYFNTGRRTTEEMDSVDYTEVATALAATLEQASIEVDRLLGEEESHLQEQEVWGKRVEIKSKRQLAKVRLGLEATTQRLQGYENSVTNALGATAGIEQHLSQSNSRVQRGKSVSHLLKYFKMFTSVSEGELATLLKSLTKARAAQRAALTRRWMKGKVSSFNPKYFTTPVEVTSSGLKEDVELPVAKPRRTSKTDAAEASATTSAAIEETTGRKKKAVFRRSGTRAQKFQQGSQPASAAISRRASRANSPALSEQPEEEEEETPSEESEGEGELQLHTVKLHRAEQAVVAAGFDRLFAARVYTEQQVEWCQRLLLLAKELEDVTEHTSNISFYSAWLRQELVTDLFHVIGCFNEFYDEHTETAVHLNYGRALLKTMELISRLYADLESSNDALLSVFFSHSVNDLGVILFSEYSPPPLPGQPPLPAPTPLYAMDHFKNTIKPELKKTFHFLMDRIKRDLIIVETVFGMTSAARQQLLSHVTDGVVKPFIMQQIKLAETHHTFMANAEATLSPRSRRKSASRVSDAISYHFSMESSLYSFYQDYMKELRGLFQSAEVEFLSKFIDVIFPDRTLYGDERPETALLIRVYTLIEEQYTRQLHPIPGEFFDVREAHMSKAKLMIESFTEVCERIKVYAPSRVQGPYVLDVIRVALKAFGKYLEEELHKSYQCLKADRDNWRLRPKSEEALLHPVKPESQQCAFRLLLFAQSTLLSLSDAIAAVCLPLVRTAPFLLKDVEEAKQTDLEELDERAEKLLNYSVQAVIIRSLSILTHYQLKTDYLVKANANKTMEETMAPPCSRACTLFCYYLTSQLKDMKEFINLSHGQLSSKVSSNKGAGGEGQSRNHFDLTEPATLQFKSHYSLDSRRGSSGKESTEGGTAENSGTGKTTAGLSATRTRARIMNYQQLLYGDGGPSSLVRTLGVTLFRGIATHLKSFTANDKGAFVYKQDVTAYKECMHPITSLDGLGAAVVEVLFLMLRETASLLLMPLDHIKEVKSSGMLRVFPNEELLKFIRIRQDVRDAFKIINA